MGFGWDSADEGKLMSSFGFGRSAFPNFLDLQEIGYDLGYQRMSLVRIAKQV